MPTFKESWVSADDLLIFLDTMYNKYHYKDKIVIDRIERSPKDFKMQFRVKWDFHG